ncbi:MAG TPA: HK97 gp10 family phage protein [Clostridium perfringens]|nr:HK97 gp10 family phage protein [Clostridium perfringens]
MALTFDFDELYNKLEVLDKKVSNEVIENALNKGAEVVLQAQKETVPVRKGPEGGNLKRSLNKGKISGSGTKKKISIGIENAKERELIYGYYQEYGTSSMVGKKWMKRAWQQSVKKANEEIEKSLADDLANL